MQCPNCGHTKTLIPRTRSDDLLDIVIRRRLCPSCNHRWYTAEVAIPTGAVSHTRDVGRLRTSFIFNGTLTYNPPNDTTN